MVFLNNVKTMEEHKRKLQDTKDDLESCLEESPYKEDQITLEEQTPFAVKFKFRLISTSREFDVDLLPTFSTDQSLGKIGLLSSFNPTSIRVNSLSATLVLCIDSSLLISLLACCSL